MHHKHSFFSFIHFSTRALALPIALALITGGLMLPVNSHAASIVAISDFYPDGNIRPFFAYDLSPNGHVVIGVESGGNFIGGNFILQDGEFSGLAGRLGTLSNYSISLLAGVSDDGGDVVGTLERFNDDVPGLQTQAFVSRNGVMTGLGDFAGGGLSSRAAGISADGSTIAGTGSRETSLEAFIYRNGTMTGIGNLATGASFNSSTATAISSDGSTVIGQSVGTTLDNDGRLLNRSEEAFIYQNGVMSSLGQLDPDVAGLSEALGVSADGSFVVGSSGTAYGRAAFIYRGGVMAALSDPHNIDCCIFEEAVGVSADGRTVVGHDQFEALIWAEIGSGQYSVDSLQNYLFDLGLDIEEQGWSTLRNTQHISDDGALIVGVGTRSDGLHQEIFIVDLGATEIPVPAAAWLFGTALLALLNTRRTKGG